MTSTRCRIFNKGLIPLTFIIVFFCSGLLPQYVTQRNEVIALYGMVIYVTLQHIHYGICMVRQICKHLNIYCFVITSKPVAIKKVQ
jgi:ethanolaminephosphotransferase